MTCAATLVFSRPISLNHKQKQKIIYFYFCTDKKVNWKKNCSLFHDSGNEVAEPPMTIGMLETLDVLVQIVALD